MRLASSSFTEKALSSLTKRVLSVAKYSGGGSTLMSMATTSWSAPTADISIAGPSKKASSPTIDGRLATPKKISRQTAPTGTPKPSKQMLQQLHDTLERDFMAAYFNTTGGTGGFAWGTDMATDTYIVRDWGTGNTATITGQQMANTSTTASSLFTAPSNWQIVKNTQPTIVPVSGRRAQQDPRILSKYLNASDILEEFIQDLGRELGVKQSEVLAIPIELFINWLIIKAAEEDGKAEEYKDIPKIPTSLSTYRRDRCRCCGRFVTNEKRQKDMLFCSGKHYDRYLEKVA